MTTKNFECVKFQRERRAELSKEYNADPDKFKDELSEFRTVEEETASAEDK